MIFSNRKSQSKIYALLVLIGLEICLGVYVYQLTQPVVSQAYVIKNGPSYILFWKSSGETFSRSFSYLYDALNFAREELTLEIGRSPSTSVNVESVWFRDDFGKRMLFWTTDYYPAPNRLTFQRKYEADVFYAAFRHGAYSTSPYGHSLSLVQRRTP